MRGLAIDSRKFRHLDAVGHSPRPFGKVTYPAYPERKGAVRIETSGDPKTRGYTGGTPQGDWTALPTGTRLRVLYWARGTDGLTVVPIIATGTARSGIVTTPAIRAVTLTSDWQRHDSGIVTIAEQSWDAAQIFRLDMPAVASSWMELADSVVEVSSPPASGILGRSK